MSTPPAPPPRVHLLAAHEAPIVAIIRRGPSKMFHVIQWDTSTDEFTHGSWFSGRLFPLRCDVSFDGQWMVYLAMGSRANTWNGCCKLPFLKTYLEWDNCGTWYGGGMWRDAHTLLRGSGGDMTGDVPFQIEDFDFVEREPDLDLTYSRMKRDGWRRIGPNRGKERVIRSGKYQVACDGDDGWQCQPHPEGPALECFYRGYLEHSHTFEFRLREFPDILTPDVEWATFDSLNNVVWSRGGWVYRASLADLRRGRAGFEADLNGLRPPERSSA